jgi:antitoxin (DNA-binding transcriptional repressor) of toxin-antitoxin stability system
MKRVKIADLKNSLSRHLEHVRAGGDIVVLDRDTPIARVVPFLHPGTPDRSKGREDAYWTLERMADLERRGIVTQPRSPIKGAARTMRPIKLPKGAPSAVALLLEMRRESTR